jgi:Lectin C-type domain
MHNYLIGYKVKFALLILIFGGLLATPGCTPDEESLTEVDLAIRWNVNSHDYLFLGPATWADASDICAFHGYHLVTVNDLSENAWLLARILESPQTQQGARHWYIGLNDIATEAGTNKIVKWAWAERPVAPVNYRNWTSGQPNNNDDQDCVSIDSNTGQWGDGWCSSGLAYICEAGF